MITLNAPDGTVVADVSDQVSELVQWLTEQPDRPRFRYSHGRHLGTLTMKRECDLHKAQEFLRGSEELND